MPPPLARRSLLGSLLAGGAAILRARETVHLRRDDGMLRLVAPEWKFLEGRTLRRLQDGAGLVFSLQVTVSPDQFRTVSRRGIDRFVVSFDLWEEKFAIVRLGLYRQQASHLSREEAQAWLLDHAGLPLQGLRPDSPHWVRAELRADDPKESGGFLLDPSLTLTRLVEWFGRTSRGESARWNLEEGPFYLAELRR
jgi:hypothetical protein